MKRVYSIIIFNDDVPAFQIKGFPIKKMWNFIPNKAFFRAPTSTSIVSSGVLSWLTSIALDDTGSTSISLEAFFFFLGFCLPALLHGSTSGGFFGGFPSPSSPPPPPLCAWTREQHTLLLPVRGLGVCCVATQPPFVPAFCLPSPAVFLQFLYTIPCVLFMIAVAPPNSNECSTSVKLSFMLSLTDTIESSVLCFLWIFFLELAFVFFLFFPLPVDFHFRPLVVELWLIGSGWELLEAVSTPQRLSMSVLGRYRSNGVP